MKGSKEKRRLVLIKGGGDVASGIAYRLFSYGMHVIVTELDKPTVVRRMTSFAQAVYQGKIDVMGVVAKRVGNIGEAMETMELNMIPVLVETDGRVIDALKPDIVVDARMAKKNLGTKITEAPIVIGVGLGFVGGRDVHAVVETHYGPKMGEVIYDGEAEKDTGVPVEIMGYTFERVIWAPKDGTFRTEREIGEHVEVGDVVAHVDDHPLVAQASGVISGLLHNGIEVKKGKKVFEVDPRDVKEYCFIIYDKSLAVGEGVLKAILTLEQRTPHGA